MGEKDPYATTLEFLFRQLPMFQRDGPVAFKKDLTNIYALLDILGRPERSFPCIHLAGTNGKGSVAHMLAAMLQAIGLQVGLYTSPHYIDFRERIKINGILMDREEVVFFVKDHMSAIKEIQPSFFEITVAMAFQYFAGQKVDIAVIETGLGGRLDSTNVVMPLLSVITNISYDHQQFLGDTLPEIASEKAGIIKSGVPVVIGESDPATRDVFELRAEALQAPIVFANEHIRVELLQGSFGSSLYEVTMDNKPLFSSLEVGLAGPYQTKNLQTAIQAALLLPAPFLPDETAIREGLKNLRQLTRFMGRWQVIGENPLILCDSAHNTAGLQLVLQKLQELPTKQLHIVMGALNDKPLDKVLPLFPAHARYYFAKPDIPRGLAVKALQTEAAQFNLEGKAYPSVREALQAAKQLAHEEDVIFVGGSIFVVAEILDDSEFKVQT